MTFSLNSIMNALNNLLGGLRNYQGGLTPNMSQSTPAVMNPSIPGTTTAPKLNPSQPGGYFGPNSAYSQGGIRGLTAALVQNAPVIGSFFGGTPGGVKYTPYGTIEFGGANAMEQPETPSVSFMPNSPFRVSSSAEELGLGGGTTQRTSNLSPGSFSSTTSGIGTTLSGQTAPVAGANNPPGKTSIGGSTGIGYGGVGGAGYSSGAIGISGQTAPVAGANLPPPPTSINNAKPVGQFEAMIKALQKLNPQSGYIQTPLEGGFGPGYGMGNALKRIREYQTMYNR